MIGADLAPFTGFGVGLRKPHYQEFLGRNVPVDFVEVVSENFMVEGGRPLDILARVRERHPVILHGVSMAIGAAEGIDVDYLKRLKALADRVRPLWVSDHLCWTGVDGVNSHDLLPVPYTEEALDVVCRNVDRAQNVLERPIVIENPTTYYAFPEQQMAECDFLKRLCSATGCFLLLDVNNLYVNCANHGFDASVYLSSLPLDRVRQIHLAGHSEGIDMLIDTHDHDVPDPVWDLFESVAERLGPVAVTIERDDDIPTIDALVAELEIAKRRMATAR